MESFKVTGCRTFSYYYSFYFWVRFCKPKKNIKIGVFKLTFEVLHFYNSWGKKIKKLLPADGFVTALLLTLVFNLTIFYYWRSRGSLGCFKLLLWKIALCLLSSIGLLRVQFWYLRNPKSTKDFSLNFLHAVFKVTNAFI